MKTIKQTLLSKFIFMNAILVNFNAYSQSYSTFSFTSSEISDGPSQWGSYGCFANGNLTNSYCGSVGLPTYFTGSYPIFSAQTSGSSATSVMDIPHSLGTDKFLTYAYVISNNLPFVKIVIYFSASLPANFGGFDIINKSDDGLSKSFTIQGYKNSTLVATQVESVPYDIPTSITMSESAFSDVDRVEIIGPGSPDMHYFGVNNFLLAEASLLPVELASFKAEKERNDVKVSWATISEYNNDYFLIEKSVDGYNWSFLDQLNGAGNSQSRLEYSAYDNIGTDNEMYYRLVQVDFDGKNRVYGPISLSNILDENNITISPNPTSDKFSVRMDFKGKQEDCMINIYSSSGILVETTQMTLENGFNQAYFETNNMVPGVYYVNTSIAPEKIIKLVIQ